MSISRIRSNPLGVSSLPIVKTRRGDSLATRILDQAPVAGPLRITRRISSKIEELKKIPFFENLNGKEFEKVYCHMLRNKASIEWYTDKIKAGNWDDVLTKGMDESEVEFLLMAAHALQKISVEELGTAFMFIDFAMNSKSQNKPYKIELYDTTAPYNTSWDLNLSLISLLSVTDLENTSPNLRFLIKQETSSDENMKMVLSVPLKYLEITRISKSEDFTLSLSYKMPNVLKCIDHFLAKRSPFSFIKPGTKPLIHGMKWKSYYEHDYIHIRLRLDFFNKNSSNFQFACDHLTSLKKHLISMEPYSKGGRPGPVEGELLWKLPKNATFNDRKRYLLEQVALFISEEGIKNRHYNKIIFNHPKEMYEHVLTSMFPYKFEDLFSEEEKAAFFGELKTLYGEKWESLEQSNS